jgi:hypothetical protein
VENEAEQSIDRTSQECADEETQRLGEFAARNIDAMYRNNSPTLDAEQNWNKIRWGTPDNDEDITHA